MFLIHFRCGHCYHRQCLQAVGSLHVIDNEEMYVCYLCSHTKRGKTQSTRFHRSLSNTQNAQQLVGRRDKSREVSVLLNASCHLGLIFTKHSPALTLNPLPNKPWLLCVCNTSLSKSQWEKEKLLITSNCSFYPTVFSTHFEELSVIFIEFEIVICKLFHFGRVYSLSFERRLKC